MPYDKELITHKLIRWEEYLNHYKLPAWKELPDIGLYMDQVILYLGESLELFQREGSSLLTSSMINNYVKTGLIPHPDKKKLWLIYCAWDAEMRWR